MALLNSSQKAPLTLFEYEAREYEWTDRDLVALAHLQRVTGVEVLRATVTGGKRVLQATQHIGVFRFGQTIVQVLPKIYQLHTAELRPDQEQEATRNLLFLLHYALQLPIREYMLAPLSRQNHDWFEGLIALFTAHLLEEWQCGPYRHYQEVENELPLLKGKLNINNHLRHPESRHRFPVTYDEFTADVPLNCVFRFVVERLWSITHDANNRLRLGRLRQWMEEITLLPAMDVSDTSTIVITRLNQRFAALLELARLFLDKGALKLNMGDISTYAFVIDMNQLFESFLTNFICRHRHEILPSSLQQCELRPQSQGIVRHLANQVGSGRAIFHLKPDVVLYDKACDCFPLLIDMKYKRLNNANGTMGVSREDFYQMYAYAHRYHCPRVLLLYPQTVWLPEPIYQPFALIGHENVIIAATIDMRADLQRREEQQKLKDTLKFLLRSEEDI